MVDYRMDGARRRKQRNFVRDYFLLADEAIQRGGLSDFEKKMFYKECKGRMESPQKCRGKTPRKAVPAISRDQGWAAPFFGGRPRRFGAGGGVMAAWVRACTGMRSACARSR